MITRRGVAIPALSLWPALSIWFVSLIALSPARSDSSPPPSIKVSNHIVSDGISLRNPKAIPNAIVEFEVKALNIPTPVDVKNQLSLANPIPDNLSLYVGNVSKVNPLPFRFEVSAPEESGSAFACDFVALSSSTDCVEFSNDGGASFDYVPDPDAQGFDDRITHIRFRLSVRMPSKKNATTNFTLRYRMRLE